MIQKKNCPTCRELSEGIVAPGHYHVLTPTQQALVIINHTLEEIIIAIENGTIHLDHLRGYIEMIDKNIDEIENI